MEQTTFLPDAQMRLRMPWPPQRNTTNELKDPADFYDRHWYLVVLLIVEVLILSGLLIYSILWNRRQQKREERSGIMKESEAYSFNLVKHFLPSIQVEKYRFRGLQKHDETITIGFEELGLELKNGKSVLASVTGTFPAGRMCAIMGPSGAGKTTFLNALCGKATYGTVTGSVFVNGVEANISDYKAVMGFVPQDDIVHESLTVGEQIRFSAELRNAAGTSIARTRLITEDVLNVMQIDHIQNCIVGGVGSRGISGGQRKRVNIGLELAANPTILFLDEPTSGLDSTSSLTIVNSLKKMTQLGMTSIMVIHQPRYSLFTLFDDVLLLGKGGRTVYLGPSLGAKPYLEKIGFEMPTNENPADWIMDVISGECANSTFADFQLPMLFNLWEQHRGELESDAKDFAVGRSWTAQDDRTALAYKLEEEWSKIDSDGDGRLSQQELASLLQMCTGFEPKEDAVHELFKRVGGRSADYVTKQDFFEFLVGLQGLVAHDRDLQEELGADNDDDEDDEDEDDDDDDDDNEFDDYDDGNDGDDDDEEKGNWRAIFSLLREKDGMSFSRSAPFLLHRFPHQRQAPLRQLPACFRMMEIVMHRRLIQWWRNNFVRFVFLAVLAVSAVTLSVMDRFVVQEQYWAAGPYLNLHTTMALLQSVYCLGTFGSERHVFWRESANGLHVRAYYLGRIIVNVFDLLLQLYLFAALYYLIAQPALRFENYFMPFLLTSWVSSGQGYFISTVVPPENAAFLSTLVSFVSCGLLGHPGRVQKMQDGGILEFFCDISSITRWTVSMSFLDTLDSEPPFGVSLVDQRQIDELIRVYRTQPQWQDKFGYWYTGVLFLFSLGLLLHIFAFVGLKFNHRDKQV